MQFDAIVSEETVYTYKLQSSPFTFEQADETVHISVAEIRVRPDMPEISQVVLHGMIFTEEAPKHQRFIYGFDDYLQNVTCAWSAVAREFLDKHLEYEAQQGVTTVQDMLAEI